MSCIFIRLIPDVRNLISNFVVYTVKSSSSLNLYKYLHFLFFMVKIYAFNTRENN